MEVVNPCGEVPLGPDNFDELMLYDLSRLSPSDTKYWINSPRPWSKIGVLETYFRFRLFFGPDMKWTRESFAQLRHLIIRTEEEHLQWTASAPNIKDFKVDSVSPSVWVSEMPPEYYEKEKYYDKFGNKL